MDGGDPEVVELSAVFGDAVEVFFTITNFCGLHMQQWRVQGRVDGGSGPPLCLGNLILEKLSVESHR